MTANGNLQTIWSAQFVFSSDLLSLPTILGAERLQAAADGADVLLL